jgi:hypothetical protein
MKKPENVIETEEYVEPHCFENDQEAALFYSYLEQEKYIAHLESKVLDLSQHIVSYRYLDDGETAEIGDEYWFNDEWIPVEKQYFPYVFRTRGFYKHRRKSNGS